jgi:hypothetical protein
LDEEDIKPSELEELLSLVRTLGKAELEFIGSITAPLCWVIRDGSGKELMKNGSVFFLDAGAGPFAVTAAHVVKECLSDTKSPMFVQCMIGGDGGRIALPFFIGDRVIDGNEEMDLATLRFSDAEIRRIGRTVLRGYVKNWPPRLAEIEGGITLCGFPGNGRRWLGRREIVFGIVGVAGFVTNANETSISIQIERQNFQRVLGQRDMSQNFDFGGMSGGPVLAIIQTEKALRFWKPAGVVIQGPNPSPDPSESISGLEIFYARPIHFIRADGTLDMDRWHQANPIGFGR